MLTLLCKLVGHHRKKPNSHVCYKHCWNSPHHPHQVSQKASNFLCKIVGHHHKTWLGCVLYMLLSSSSPQSMESCANLFGIIIRSQLVWKLPSYYSSRNQHTPPQHWSFMIFLHKNVVFFKLLFLNYEGKYWIILEYSGTFFQHGIWCFPEIFYLPLRSWYTFEKKI